MEKGRFVILFVVVQLFFVFFHIHKYSTITKLTYEKQKNERIYKELLERREELAHALEQLKKDSTIKTEAKKRGMIPIKLSHLKRLDELS